MYRCIDGDVSACEYFDMDEHLARWMRRIETQLDLNHLLLQELITMATANAAAVTDLTSAVADETSIDASIVTLLNGIAAQLTAAVTAAQASGSDVAAAVNAQVALIKANTANIKAAIVANTPVTPPQAAATPAAPATP